jgi:adenylate cyclase
MGKLQRTSGNDAGVPGRAIAIGAFRFTPRTGELWRGLEQVKLTPRAAAVLTVLAERAQQVVTKDELFAHVWKGRTVGEETLTSCIQELRQALGDDARQPRFIETWHRRGYKLIVSAVTESSAMGGPLSPAPSDKPSITVLPFQNMNGDSGQEYFADGITEDITTALSRYHELAVIACNSAFTFKGKGTDVSEVAHHLGARYLLKGSVRLGGERVRISAQLVAAPSGEHLWAERYDRERGDILSLQDEISRQIVATIAPEIRRAEERRADRLPAQGLQAHDLAMRANALLREGDIGGDCTAAVTGATTLERAVVLAEHAVAADPTSASAYAALARAHTSLPEPLYFQPESAAILDKAVVAAETLRRLDPSNHTAYLVLGQVCLRRRQASDALAHLRRANELNPNDCNVLRWLAWAEFNVGLASESSQHYKQALQLSPRDTWRHVSYWGLAWAAFVGGAPEEGVAWARTAIADQPSYYPARTILAACQAECCDREAAQQGIAYLLEHHHDYIRSRLAGYNYFGVPELSRRFTEALRKAAGPLLAESGQTGEPRRQRA